MLFPNDFGIFTISLDFELYWGVRDVRSLESYQTNLLGARRAIPAMLEIFKEFEIHATWATVGFLFLEQDDDLQDTLPQIRPQYHQRSLDPYEEIPNLGENEEADPYRLAPSLIRQIAATPHQEIGSHTLSHYYCLEPGQNEVSFEEDLKCALALGKRHEMRLSSLVFPRNQVNEKYLGICNKHGITAVRGNPDSWLHRKADREKEPLLRRAFRLADHYVPLSGHQTFTISPQKTGWPVDVKASRFLRPFSPRLKKLDPLRYMRLAGEMTRAAERKEIFHLWWHPHNFGTHLDENLTFLRRLLNLFSSLQNTAGMRSFSMGEVARQVAVVKSGPRV